MGDEFRNRVNKELQALSVLSIIHKHRGRGISAQGIIRLMNKMERKDNYYPANVERWIRDINKWGEWYGYENKLVEKDASDDGRIPLYKISDSFDHKLIDDIIRVLLSVMIFKHGSSHTISNLKRNHNHISILINLLYALEQSRVIEIITVSDGRRIPVKFSPYMIDLKDQIILYGTLYRVNKIFNYKIDNKIKSITITDEVFTKSADLFSRIKNMITEY